jgi:ribosomal protein S18 acetylase RimI-like enzyme
MITTRPFKEIDNAVLLEIEKRCPQGDEKRALGIDKKDIIARYRMYDNWKVLVAEYEGEVAGWTGWTVNHDPIRKSKYAYLAEVVVRPESSGKGVATKLVSEAEKDAKEREADYIYCYIYEPNQASKSPLPEAWLFGNGIGQPICRCGLQKSQYIARDFYKTS